MIVFKITRNGQTVKRFTDLLSAQQELESWKDCFPGDKFFIESEDDD